MGKINDNLEILCEYQKNPLGIQNQHPRFSWRLTGEYGDTQQNSYQIQVWNGRKILWNSGEIFTSKNQAVSYQGQELQSRTEYHFSVEIEVQRGEKTFCFKNWGTFETGIFQNDQWKGCWIQPVYDSDAAPLIRRRFFLQQLPKKARLYIVGLGYQEITINGVKVGNARLDPGWTDYRKTILYRVYNIGKYLKIGENVLGVELGKGWYAMTHPFFEKAIGRQPDWNGTLKMLCNLWMDETCICTEEDGEWIATPGPIVENSIYDGEKYDGQLEKTGWNLPGYEPSMGEWSRVRKTEGPGGALISQILPEITEGVRRKPVYAEYIGEDSDYTMLIDFGQNMAGWADIRLEGQVGQKVVIRYGEVKGRDGSLDQRNLRLAKSRDCFILGRDGIQSYHPKFTYHGFRYVQIEMDPGIVIHSIEAVEVRSQVKRVADFKSSDPWLNRLYEMGRRTEESNLHSVPTDCPQRDERLGWVNDMTIRYENSVYNFEMLLFYEKWMRDLTDSQDENGAIPDTAPYFFGSRPGTHITSVFVLLPWLLYRFYGDRQIIEEYYEHLKKYVLFKLSQRTSEGILPENYIGDWAPPMTEAQWGWGENAVPANCPQSLFTTCYLLYDCMIMEKISDTLGKTEDCGLFAQEASMLNTAIQKNFYHPEKGYYGSGTQGCNLFPLFLGIVPQTEKGKVFQNLLYDITVLHQNHITTGNQMTKFLYEVLVKEGEVDQALKMTREKTYPSIGYMVEQGATTIWERWELLTVGHMNSHNHPMHGAFLVWLLKGLGGLEPVPSGKGPELNVHPSIPKELDWVEVKRESLNGEIRIKWEKKKKGVKMEIHVPWNTKVRVRIPEGYLYQGEKEFLLKSGNYEMFLNEQ